MCVDAINTQKRRWLTTGAFRGGEPAKPVGPAARVPGKVASPVRALRWNSDRPAGVISGMYTNNPEIRLLIEQGILRIAPLRPRSMADVPRIRAASKRA